MSKFSHKKLSKKGKVCLGVGIPVLAIVGSVLILHFVNVAPNNKTEVDGSRFSDHTISEELTADEIAENQKNAGSLEYEPYMSDKDYEDSSKGNNSETDDKIKNDERYLDDTDSDEIVVKGARNGSYQEFVREK